MNDSPNTYSKLHRSNEIPGETSMFDMESINLGQADEIELVNLEGQADGQEMYKPLLPVTKIKRICKLDQEFLGASTDSYILLTKATEMFAKKLAAKISLETLAANKVMVTYSDCASAVAHNESLEFLADVVPKKISISSAAKKVKEFKALES